MFGRVQRQVALLALGPFRCAEEQRAEIDDLCITRILLSLRFGRQHPVPGCNPRYQPGLAALRRVHLLLVLLDLLLADKPHVALTAPFRVLLLLVALQMRDEEIERLHHVASGGGDGGGLQAERTLYCVAAVVRLVEVLDDLLVVGTPVRARATLVRELGGAVFLGHVLAEDEGVHIVRLADQTHEPVVKSGFARVGVAEVLQYIVGSGDACETVATQLGVH